MVLSAYDVQWNGESLPIQKAVQLIQSGSYPDMLSVSHPSHSRISITHPGMYGSYYVVAREGAALPGIGVRRSFASRPLDQEPLLDYLYDVYPDLESELADLRVGRNKLTRLQLEAAKKLANRQEGVLGKNIPTDIRARLAQMLGEKAPAKGSNSVLQNFSKINTSLFQGGNKRKTRKSRTTRKSRKVRKPTRRR